MFTSRMFVNDPRFGIFFLSLRDLFDSRERSANGTCSRSSLPCRKFSSAFSLLLALTLVHGQKSNERNHQVSIQQDAHTPPQLFGKKYSWIQESHLACLSGAHKKVLWRLHRKHFANLPASPAPVFRHKTYTIALHVHRGEGKRKGGKLNYSRAFLRKKLCRPELLDKIPASWFRKKFSRGNLIVLNRWIRKKGFENFFLGSA